MNLPTQIRTRVWDPNIKFWAQDIIGLANTEDASDFRIYKLVEGDYGVNFIAQNPGNYYAFFNTEEIYAAGTNVYNTGDIIEHEGKQLLVAVLNGDLELHKYSLKGNMEPHEDPVGVLRTQPTVIGNIFQEA